MIIREFKEANRTLSPPRGMDNCEPLPIFTDGKICVSCWLPTAEELEAIMNGGPVYLLIWSGQTQPPACVTAMSPFVAVAEIGEMPGADVRLE